MFKDLYQRFIEWALSNRRWPILLPLVIYPLVFLLQEYYSLSFREAVWHPYASIGSGIILLSTGILFYTINRNNSRLLWSILFGLIGLSLIFSVVVRASRPLPEDKLVVTVTLFSRFGNASESDAEALSHRIVEKIQTKIKEGAPLTVKYLPKQVIGFDEDAKRRAAQELGTTIDGKCHIVIWGEIRKDEDELFIHPRVTVANSIRRVSLNEQSIGDYKSIEPSHIALKEKAAKDLVDLVMFIYGLAYFKLGDWDEAIKMFAYSHSDAGYFYSGDALLSRSTRQRNPRVDLLAAIEAYDKVDTNSGVSLMSLYNNRGVAYSRVDRFDKAIEDYSRTMKVDANDFPIYYNRARAYRAQNIYDKAVQDFTKVIELKPDFIDAYLERGMVHIEAKRINEAFADLNRGIELAPDYAPAYWHRGLAYSMINEHHKAVDNYSLALERNPGLMEAYANRGASYSELKKYNEALSDLDKAIALGPEKDEVHVNKGSVLFEVGRTEEAIAELSKVIAWTTNNATALVLRAKCYQKMKRYRESIDDLDFVIQSDTNNVDALGTRGNSYNTLGEYEKAISDYNRALSIDPKVFQAYSNRAQAYLFSKQYRRAIDDYTKYFVNRPDDIDYTSLNNRGICYENLGMYSKALEDFSEAVRLNPTYAKGYLNRGNLYKHLGKKSLAIGDLRKVLSLTDRQDLRKMAEVQLRALGVKLEPR